MSTGACCPALACCCAGPCPALPCPQATHRTQTPFSLGPPYQESLAVEAQIVQLPGLSGSHVVLQGTRGDGIQWGQLVAVLASPGCAAGAALQGAACKLPGGTCMRQVKTQGRRFDGFQSTAHQRLSVHLAHERSVMLV